MNYRTFVAPAAVLSVVLAGATVLRAEIVEQIIVKVNGEIYKYASAAIDHAQAQRVREPHHRVHHRAGVLLLLQVAHETAVDLESLDREALQVGQAGVARAEVVQCQPDPQLLEPLECLQGVWHGAHGCAFRDLQLQA